MNIARNHMIPHTGAAPGGSVPPGDEFTNLPFPGDLQHMDWQALRARVFASRDTLASPGVEYTASRLHLRGSFEGAAASKLTVYHSSLRSVNPDGSTNLKSQDCNIGLVADADGNGERG